MHLAHVIENAVILEANSNGSSVGAGSIVSIVFEGDTVVEKYLVGSIEEKPEDLMVVSPASPMGAALLGSSIGDVVEYEAPTGMLLKVSVVEIE